MTLFRPAESTSAFLKMGLLGFAGSGKTKTASLTAIGLVKYAREHKVAYADKPVFFIDTETGSDWVKPDFEKAGVPLFTAKTRAFSDLLQAVPEAQANGSLLLIDSITHFWKELCDSYSKRKAAQFKAATYRLQFQDWGYLKGEWGKFTDLFINSPLHIILAGRAGYEYDYFEDEGGKKELEKTGIKMKAEGEMGFEPSLLVLMERCQKVEGGTVTKTWREATVLKDRSTLLDGKVFVDPTFMNFRPHIELLNLGGMQLGVDTSRTSEHMIPADKKDWTSTHRTIVLEEIEAVLVKRYPSTGKEDKLAKQSLIEKHFDTASWTAVTLMPVNELRDRFDTLYRELEGRPSHYARAVEQGGKSEINDEIPDHSAAPAIAPNGDTPALSLKDRLLADLKELKTTNDCLSWGITVSNMKDLKADEYIELSKALMVRQQEIAKNPGNGHDGGDDPKKNEPDSGKSGEGAPPVTPKPEPEEQRPAARGKGKGHTAPAQAERSMADLMGAG